MRGDAIRERCYDIVLSIVFMFVFMFYVSECDTFCQIRFSFEVTSHPPNSIFGFDAFCKSLFLFFHRSIKMQRFHQNAEIFFYNRVSVIEELQLVSAAHIFHTRLAQRCLGIPLHMDEMYT
jgi:hypothetical protein